MEFIVLALCMLLVGFIFIFCTKPQYKSKILGIFMIMSLLSLYYPCHYALNAGTAKELNMDYLFLSQKLSFVMDPITAFINVLLIVPCFLYALSLFMDKNKNIQPWVSETLIASVLFALFAINILNGIYFCAGIFLFNACLLLLTNRFANNLAEARNKTLLIYAFSIVISAAIMILGMFSHSFQFSDMVKSLVSNINYSNAVFVIVFMGFGLPLLLSDYLFGTNNLLQNPSYKEVFLIKIVTSVLYFYGLLRFIGMGAVPVLKTSYIITAVLIGFILMNLYKLYKARLVQNIYSYINTIQMSLIPVSILTSIMGYIYGVPVISILGCISGLFFLINTVITDYAMRYNLNEALANNTKSDSEADIITGSWYRKLFSAGMFCYAGLPYTLGFIGWLTLFGTVIFGIMSLISELRVFSIILFVLFLLIFIALAVNVFIILKRHFYLDSDIIKTSIPKLSSVLIASIIALSIFPLQLIKTVIVPVSFLNGGTKYVLIFDAIKSISITYTFYMLGIVVLVALYVITKILILKQIKKQQKP